MGGKRMINAYPRILYLFIHTMDANLCCQSASASKANAKAISRGSTAEMLKLIKTVIIKGAINAL